MDDKSLYPIITAVIITALLVGGAVYYAQKSKVDDMRAEIENLKDQVSNSKSNADSLSLTTKEEIENQIAKEKEKYPEAGENSNEKIQEVIKPWKNSNGWDIYENQEAEYEISHPEKWIVLRNKFYGCGENCECEENILIQNLPYVGPLGNGPKEGSALNLRIFEYSSPSDLTIKKWIEILDIPEADKQARIKLIKTMFIAGENTQVQTGGVDTSWSNGITFIRNNKVYDFNYFSGSEEQFKKDADTFEKIIASFKITTGGNVLRNWKTYTNSKHNYSISYPSDYAVQTSPEGVSFSNAGNHCQIDILPFVNNSDAEINDLTKKGYQKSAITIAGVSATRLTKSQLGGIADAIYFSKGNDGFRISRSEGQAADSCKNNFNEMIKSFKFLN